MNYFQKHYIKIFRVKNYECYSWHIKKWKNCVKKIKFDTAINNRNKHETNLLKTIIEPRVENLVLYKNFGYEVFKCMLLFLSTSWNNNYFCYSHLCVMLKNLSSWKFFFFLFYREEYFKSEVYLSKYSKLSWDLESILKIISLMYSVWRNKMLTNIY